MRYPIFRQLVECQRRTIYKQYSTLPRVATSTFWQTLIPKPFRSSQNTTTTTTATTITATTIPNTKPFSVPIPQSKPWNPATFFIVIFLLIGSNAMNTLAIKKDHLSFSRQTDARIETLKEAIGMVQQGLEVDVKRLLGTGVESDEQEWFAVLRELQEDGKVARGRRGAFDGENEVEGKRGGQG